DPIDALYLGTEVGGRFLGGDLFERPFYVGTGDGFAVVKYGIAQLEQPGSRAISDPGLGEFRAQRALGVVGEKAAVDHQLDGAGGGAGMGPRLDARRIARQAEGKNARGARASRCNA